jgi:heme-degrading monooxygenase HmoA
MDAPWTSGSWTVKDGMADDFIAAWRELAEWTVGQYPGSRAWLLQDRDRPQVFLSAGPWNSDEAIATWRASDGFQQRVARIRETLESFEARTLDEVARAG